jgi:hypothetical protein
MGSKKGKPSQLMDLFLHVADHLGSTTDRQVAGLADVSPDSIPNWRSGTVREFKPRTLTAIKDGIAARLRALQQHAEHEGDSVDTGLVPLEIEVSSGPTALQRQFADRLVYDYLGHRFLYFDAQGALAWENLIREGYGQERWLKGIKDSCRASLDRSKGASGQVEGPLARHLGLGSGGCAGLDVIGLGPGEGSKEVVVLRELLKATTDPGSELPWLTFALVEVSIPLLLTATAESHAACRGHSGGPVTVMPFVADFEEGELGFLERLPSARGKEQGLRLVLILGNVFGNVRHEGRFLDQKVSRMVRPGDLLWVEVGLRPDRMEDDPVFAMTQPQVEPTAAYTNRISLLEGPYRRYMATLGRTPSDIETRIWLRENDDTCPVPGSVNFCHDLVIKSERRVCTMLYSRRYEQEALSRWWESRGYSIELTWPVVSDRGISLGIHYLLRRR